MRRYRSASITVSSSFLLLTIALVFITRASARGDSPPPSISIEIESSRSKLVAAEGITIVGNIQNTSQSTVYIRESSLTMTLPVELEGARESVYGYYAYFPTEPHDPKKMSQYTEYLNNVIALAPGDTYAAYWTVSSVDRTSADSSSSTNYVFRQIAGQLQFLFFYPGDYKILVTAKYWTNPKQPPDAYRTVTKSATISVGAPLFVILIGAALGGLMAYIILPKRAGRLTRVLKPSVESSIRHALGALGAMLLSVIVTIMLSRVAETQFIISVTVNDVWGAIVVGFVAQYGGTRLLAKLVASARGDQSEEGSGHSRNESAADTTPTQPGPTSLKPLDDHSS